MNAALFAQLLPVLLQLGASLPGLIHIAQVAFSGKPGVSGPAKKEFVQQAAATLLGAAQAGLPAGTLTDEHVSTILAGVSQATDSTVAAIKAVNGFTGVVPAGAAIHPNVAAAMPALPGAAPDPLQDPAYLAAKKLVADVEAKVSPASVAAGQDHTAR